MSESQILIEDVERSYGTEISKSSEYSSHLMKTERNTQIKLSWNKIDVFAMKKSFCSSKVEVKQILKNAYGVAHPGELLVIMGSSGAGKTTLLNVLTQRNVGNLQITGSVYANDNPAGKSLTSLSAYVQQDDLMFPNITVYEHLKFQSNLRMDASSNSIERDARVEEVMKELGLLKCKNTIIGGVSLASSKKGISGGEKKRLAIASELLTNPELMFLDEPTSGLDSFMAENVIQSLKNLTKFGKTVLCTIHQPSSEVFQLFDKLLLMGEGKVVFFGSQKNAHRFFKTQGMICPVHHNPADFFIHSLAITTGNEEKCRERVYDISNNFAKSKYNKIKEITDASSQITKEAFHGRSMFKASWGRQFFTLLQRAILSTRRQPQLTIISFFQTVMISTVVGLLYLQTTYNVQGVQNINGAIFLTLMQCTFPYIFPVINTFCPELQIFRREHWNGMYRTDTYFLSKMIAELPVFVIMPIIFSTIVYYMIGFNPDPMCYLTFVAVCLLCAMTSVSTGYLVSCACSSIQMALAITPPLILPLLLFGGIFLNAGDIPVYFYWLKYISWFNYTYEILIVNQWSTIDKIACKGSNATCETGRQVIEALNYSEDNTQFNFIMLVVLIIVFRVLAYIVLALKSRRKS